MSSYCPGDEIPGTCMYAADSAVSRDISIVAIVSSLLSCLGSALIVYVYARWPAVRTGSRAIITFLAIADFVTAFGYIMGSSNYLHYTSYGNFSSATSADRQERCNNLFTPVCKIQSYITTTSSMMSFLWTLILAVYLYLTVVKGRVQLAQRLVPLYHVIAWGLPTAVVFAMLAAGVLGYAPVASANWCFIGPVGDDAKRITLIMVGGKFLEIATYLLVVVLYVGMRLYIRKENEMLRLAPGSTSKAALIQQVDKKLTLIPLVFILLRIWGTLEFIITESLHKDCNPGNIATDSLVALRFLQAIGDGGQGWGNALLYIFSAPKIRMLLLKEVTTCCSRMSSVLQDCSSHIRTVRTNLHDATSKSRRRVRMSVQEGNIEVVSSNSS